MKIKLFIVPFLLGVFIAVFGFQAYTIYQLRAVANEDHVVLTQVVNFLNDQIRLAQSGQAAQAQKTTTTKTPSNSTSTSSKK